MIELSLQYVTEDKKLLNVQEQGVASMWPGL